MYLYKIVGIDLKWKIMYNIGEKSISIIIGGIFYEFNYKENAKILKRKVQ